MRKNEHYEWDGEMQEGVLFAIRRLDEILFFYTKDTYKAPIFNSKMLVNEYIDVCNKIDLKLLDAKNEEKIVEELICKLEADKEALELIGKNIFEEFKKNYQSYNKREERQYIELFKSSLSGKVYLKLIKEHLLLAVKKTEKSEIDRLLLQFVCEVKNIGYEPRFLYKCLNEQLWNTEIVDFEKFKGFIDSFSGKIKQYKLLIEEQRELADFCVNLAKEYQGISFSKMSSEKIPDYMHKTDEKSVFIVLDSIKALDEYAAVEMAKSIIKTFDHFYLFYKHRFSSSDSKCYVWINGKYTSIRPEAKGIQKSIKGVKQENLIKRARGMFDFATEQPDNFYNLIRIMDIHNTAVGTESASNALLSLWSISELLLEKENAISSGSRINQIASMMQPFLIYNYIQGLVNQFKDDFGRLYEEKCKRILKSINEGTNELERMYAFIVLDKYDKLRKNLYEELNEHPLLRYRLFSLNDTMRSNKGIKKLIERHKKKTEWQIYRIYRSRNCIIHDGEKISHIEDLVENLHSYIDELCKGIIENASKRLTFFSVEDSIYEMKIKNKFYMERLDKAIDEDNLFDYLYF